MDQLKPKQGIVEAVWLENYLRMLNNLLYATSDKVDAVDKRVSKVELRVAVIATVLGLGSSTAINFVAVPAIRGTQTEQVVSPDNEQFRAIVLEILKEGKE